jgi:hypothetical protein
LAPRACWSRELAPASSTGTALTCTDESLARLLHDVRDYGANQGDHVPSTATRHSTPRPAL